MKILKKQSLKLSIISAFCALVATLSCAQGVPHDRVIQDFTRTNRLTGTPSANLSNTVIPNQASYQKAWTSFFLGQNKTINFGGNLGVTAVTINQNGTASLRVPQGYTYNTIVPTGPSGLAVIDNVMSCTYRKYTIYPVFSDNEILNGLAPHDWTFNGTELPDPGCG